MMEPPRTLSEREIDVLRLLAKGASNQQIADELVISVNTVKVHVRNIFDKLGAQSRTEATLYAIRSGLVPLPNADLDEATRQAEASRAEPIVSRANGAATAESGALDEESTVAVVLPPTTPPVTLRSHQPRYVLWLTPLVILLVGLVSILVWQTTSSASRLASTPMAAPTQENAIITTAGQKWRELTALPTARGGLALVAHGDSLYAIGGQTATDASPKVERYSLDNTWLSKANKPTPVRDIQAVVVRGQIYVPGGCDGQGKPLNIVEVYNPSTDKWATAPHLPRPVCGYALAAVEGKIYLMGGWDGTTYRAETLVLAPGASEWQTGPAMPTARAYAGAAVVDGVIFVVGGSNGTSLTTNEQFDPSAETSIDAWKTLAPLPEARSRLGVAAVGRRVYALGGGPASLGLASYDVSADAWRVEETNFSAEWRGLGLAANDVRLYAIGGDGPLTVNRAYQALFQILLPPVRPGP